MARCPDDTLSYQTRISNFGELIGNDAGSIEDAAQCAKKRDKAASDVLLAAFARVAFITPEAIDVVYDAFTRGWLGIGHSALSTSPERESTLLLLQEKAKLPEPFWTSFWKIVSDAGKGIAATEITQRIFSLERELPPAFNERAEAAAHSHCKVTKLGARHLPELFTIETLAKLPPGSLGAEFYRVVVENKFDIEVLDRGRTEIQNMGAGRRYLNVRMLQMHDVWHLVAGYRTTSLHETALSSFQMAQFGHNYSAMYLATIFLLADIYQREGLDILFQVVAEAWQHGRKSPNFMDIEWETEWHDSIENIRRRYAIYPFDSIYDYDLVERGIAAANHPIVKGVQWLDKRFDLRLFPVLSRHALRLHVFAHKRNKRRASR